MKIFPERPIQYFNNYFLEHEVKSFFSDTYVKFFAQLFKINENILYDIKKMDYTYGLNHTKHKEVSKYFYDRYNNIEKIRMFDYSEYSKYIRIPCFSYLDIQYLLRDRNINYLNKIKKIPSGQIKRVLVRDITKKIGKCRKIKIVNFTIKNIIKICRFIDEKQIEICKIILEAEKRRFVG